MSALRTLLGLVVLLVVALVFPEVASAKSVTGAENRVGVFNLDGQVGTGVEADRSVEHHRAFGDAEYDSTAGSPHAAKGAGRLTPQAQRSVRSLSERLAEHRQKLDAFRRNPDAFDNKGFLKNAPSPEIRQRIIDGRIRHLENEISNFEKQIAELLGGG